MSIFAKALSVFVAYYPEKPTKSHKKAMHQFLRIFFLVLDHSHVFMPRHRGRMDRKIFDSRTSLTHWLETKVRVKIWYDAALTLRSPALWGPIIWNFLHSMGLLFNFPQRQLFVLLLVILPDIIPCPKCSKNFSKLLSKHKVSKTKVSSKEAYLNLLTKLHKQVNAHSKKNSLI
jgi:hypothetical protein